MVNCRQCFSWCQQQQMVEVTSQNRVEHRHINICTITVIDINVKRTMEYERIQTIINKINS